MKEEDKEIPTISLATTSGLSSISQMVNTTGDEIFTFVETTTKELSFIYSIFPLYNLKRKKRKPANFSFDWEGGLSELGKKIGAVELKHKASSWR